jgi:hypothetical protein
VIEKRAHVPFFDQFQRISVLEPRGHGLTKLASVLPEVESFASQIQPDDGYYWLHVIALTASEYYGQNRNGDHWSIECLTHFADGWTGKPVVDRELAKTLTYGAGTFYGAHSFPHHVNKDPAQAIGDVELVVWNPKQFWVELVIRLDKARTSQSKVKWVLDRIGRGAPFDVSMGAKVPFDMATTGDIKAYRAAQKMFDPSRHRSPADAVIEEHRRRKSVDGIGIYGLSITRDDYIQECKTSLGKMLPTGFKVGVRNDYPKFFDISIVWVGADKVAKYITKFAGLSERRMLTDAMLRHDPIAYHVDQAYGMAKAASAKTAVVKKVGDIEKDVPPAFDDKSVHLLSDMEPDLPEPAVDYLRRHPDSGQSLSTLSSMGIILKPGELSQILGDRELPIMHEGMFAPEVAARLLAVLRRRSSLSPVVERRLVAASQFGRDAKIPAEPDEKYLEYRRRLMPLIEAAERIFEKNKDLKYSLGSSGGKLVNEATRKYARLAYLPRELTVSGGSGGAGTERTPGQMTSPPEGQKGY